MDDWRLLQEYVQNGSETAFKDLVNRYLDLVYSVSLRKLGNPHDAEEVTQIVFCRLARKARQLHSKTVIVGWLYQATCLESLNYLRADRRRRQREQEAALMNPTDYEVENSWHQVAVHLDEALTQMDEQERLVILQRFFQRKPLRELGETLGINEDAARMRVNRALEKLRGLLTSRGVVCSSIVLGDFLAGRAVHAAPMNVVQSVHVAWPQVAQTAGISSSFVKLFIFMAKAKLRMTLAAALTLLLMTNVGLYLWNEHQQRQAELLSAAASDRTNSGASGSVLLPETIPHLSKPLPPLEQSPEIQDAIANLRKALRREPVDENGNLTSDYVWDAMRAFGSNMKAAIPTLLESLQETNNEQVPWGVVSAFLFMGKEADGAIPSLIDLLRSETQPNTTRIFAAQSLGAIRKGWDETRPGDAEAVSISVPDLVNLLNGDAQMRMNAANTLGEMGDYAKDAIPALVELLTYSATPEEAEAEIKTTRQSDQPIDPDLLKTRMNDMTRWVKTAGIDALRDIGAEAAIPQIETMLNDSDQKVRADAGIALWKIAGRTDGASALAGMIYPPNQSDNLWGESLKTLAAMGPDAKAAVPALQKLCNFVNKGIYEPALAALQKIDPEAAANVRQNAETPPPAANPEP
jgi:RNA polymerase sigma factor (sigma-70 family)